MSPLHLLPLPHRAALLAVLIFAASTAGQEAAIQIDVGQTRGRVGRYLAGACIEDVNHEIYGGIYSQMIFGESFQEPPLHAPLRGFRAYGGRWSALMGELRAEGGPGPKLVSDHPPFADGEVGVEVLFPDRRAGNAGLIVRVARPGIGADNFDGYEVSLDPARGVLVLGRHRHNWEHLRDTPCEIPVGRWISLAVAMVGRTLTVQVDGKSIVSYEDRDHPLPAGAIGLRPWQREARYRNLWVRTGGTTTRLPFERDPEDSPAVSGMWAPVRRGTARAAFALETERPFIGRQSQKIALVGGAGEVGVENRGLNRQGRAFRAGKPYEGYVWVRSEKPCPFLVTLESGDGARVHAETELHSRGADWQRLEFTVTPKADETAGRLVIVLRQPGALVVGHVFLQPGAWGRFRALPLRRDVVEGLIEQKLSVLRYGGSMVNHAEYRWKNMIGPRERRPPTAGFWYAHSSNGWGIFDFLDLCEAAGFLGIPALNMDETPGDLADFIEYVNGPADSPWGRRRQADGHPAPYGLRYLELGNEERIDEKYFDRFRRLAEAIWARDPKIALVVGDFMYNRPIRDPDRITGAASGITSLAAHRKILELAKQSGREVWFDIHIDTDGPGASDSLRALPSYVEALQRIADGTPHKVVVFELNAGNHTLKRALGNAVALNTIERLGERIAVVCSANALQVDGQNDNGWDQGLLFLNPRTVWPQPPYFVTQLFAAPTLPWCVRAEVQSPGNVLDVTAKRDEQGKVLQIQVVNVGARPLEASLRVDGFTPARRAGQVIELSGPLDAVNTVTQPRRVEPRQREWQHGLNGGGTRYTFAAHSFTVLRLE
jgi:alpha-L-arabinofuranosidase